MKPSMKQVSLLITFLILTACSTLSLNNKKKSPYINKTARQIYAIGYKHMQDGNYDDAVKAYQGVESNYPYGKYTTQAQLNTIYCNYKLGQSDAAVQSADHFINLHPSFSQLDYAYYMKGLSKMTGKPNILSKIISMPASERDISALTQAFLYFKQFLELYPNSKYAPAARTRMIHLRNQIAESQLNAADFYYKKKAYIASANRANLLIRHYDHATSMPKALQLLSKDYQKMNLTQLKRNIDEVYQLNYK